MPEPIEVKLRSNSQIAIARLQDSIVEAFISVDSDIILHGGTAIWRCYSGNRFSDDVDVYATDRQVKKMSHELGWALSRRGIMMDYPKYTQRVVEIHNEDARAKLESMEPERGIRPVEREYEKSDGSKIMVRTLSVQSFIMEKISTYRKRKYIRDLYDIYHLVSVEKPGHKASAGLRKLVRSAEPAMRNQNLADIVYAGAAPSFGTMINYIKGKLE